MSRILIIEDEEAIADLEKDYLELSGFQVEIEDRGDTGLTRALKEEFDLIILDLMLPGVDGFEICKQIREGKNIPVIMVSAKKDDIDKIRGLGLGADDYMTKPFSPAELMAHLRALTRRQGDVVFETLTAGDLTLNLESLDLTCGAETIRLSQKEFAIARILLGSPGAVVSKEALIARAWGPDSNASENNVEAYISFLRKKIGHVGSTARIETIRSVGYRLAESAGR